MHVTRCSLLEGLFATHSAECLEKRFIMLKKCSLLHFQAGKCCSMLVQAEVHLA